MFRQKMARVPDLDHAKYVVVHYEDGYLDTPTNLQKAIKYGVIELLLDEPNKWDLRANFSGSGWAYGVIVAKAEVKKEIDAMYKALKKEKLEKEHRENADHFPGDSTDDTPDPEDSNTSDPQTNEATVASTRYSVSHQVLVKISKISSQREI